MEGRYLLKVTRQSERSCVDYTAEARDTSPTAEGERICVWRTEKRRTVDRGDD